MSSHEPLAPRVDGDTCVRCRKKFKPGDRVTTVFIVEKIGRNPGSRQWGAYLNTDFEMAHIDCQDSQLSGRLITL